MKAAIAILAAGEAKRFGSIKQLANINSKPLLQHVLENCQAAIGEACVYLVLGANYALIRDELNLADSHILYNSEWQSGISSSICHAVNALENTCDAILFVAGDQPLLCHQHFVALLDHHRSHPGMIIAAEYDSKPGIPALLPKEYFPDLRELSGDSGAKKLLEKAGGNIILIAMPEAAADVDTPADLLKLKA